MRDLDPMKRRKKEGDIRAADWEYILTGKSYKEYVQPVVDAYATAREGAGTLDRNDVLRPAFNRLAGKPYERIANGVNEFYGNTGEMFARMIAFEIGEVDCLTNGVGLGLHYWREYEYSLALGMAAARFGWLGLNMLDHGAGRCHMSLAASYLGITKVSVRDYDIPARRLLQHGMASYSKNMYRPYWDLFLDPEEPFVVRDGGYNLVISMDVLEHVADPVLELDRIYKAMAPGGILLLGTFFNSCDGKDPQHLDEHAKYQDTQLWASVVSEIGFRVVGRDPRGVEKVYEKVEHCNVG